MTGQGDERWTRRQFLGAASAALAAGAVGQACATPPPTPMTPLDDMGGLMLVYSEFAGAGQLDFFELPSGDPLATFSGLRATHAITPVEAHNRFVIHGRGKNGSGEVWVIDVDPAARTWKQPRVISLGGGTPLHWQPNKGTSLIQFNTTSDGRLHVLDTETLALDSYEGGGNHSNMAFFNEDKWLLATDRLGEETVLRVVDRASRTILSETPVGPTGHGVTVNDKTGVAYVWADGGVHKINLAPSKVGQHMGMIKPARAGQRSWFCWTPQGGRYCHDYTWNPGDTYSPWLTVLDTEKGSMERIETPGERPGILQVSPDGRWAASGSHSSRRALLFDLTQNRFEGAVEVGRASGGFFDRDLAFARDRTRLYVTNPGDRSVSVVNTATKRGLGRIELGLRPLWMKVLTV